MLANYKEIKMSNDNWKKNGNKILPSFEEIIGMQFKHDKIYDANGKYTGFEVKLIEKNIGEHKYNIKAICDSDGNDTGYQILRIHDRINDKLGDIGISQDVIFGPGLQDTGYRIIPESDNTFGYKSWYKKIVGPKNNKIKLI